MKDKIDVITSYSKEGYYNSGKLMVSSFVKHWPKEICLTVYIDEDVKEKVISENVKYVILDNPDLSLFKKRHEMNEEAKGLGSKMKDGKQYFIFDAIKFSHKVFAVIDFVEKNETDILLWLDGDTRTHANVSYDDVISWCPSEKFASYLARPWKYTETGFHMFRMKHKISKDFFEKWKSYYVNDTVFKLSGWTDCHTYDESKLSFNDKHWHNLSPDTKVGHPFINGVLGNFMDHMKGERKMKGTSNKKDLKISKKGSYWNNIK
jgi:hypothetical protein